MIAMVGGSILEMLRYVWASPLMHSVAVLFVFQVKKEHAVSSLLSSCVACSSKSACWPC